MTTLIGSLDGSNWRYNRPFVVNPSKNNIFHWPTVSIYYPWLAPALDRCVVWIFQMIHWDCCYAIHLMFLNFASYNFIAGPESNLTSKTWNPAVLDSIAFFRFRRVPLMLSPLRFVVRCFFLFSVFTQSSSWPCCLSSLLYTCPTLLSVPILLHWIGSNSATC